jgi:hypothetical protein
MLAGHVLEATNIIKCSKYPMVPPGQAPIVSEENVSEDFF